MEKQKSITDRFLMGIYKGLSALGLIKLTDDLIPTLIKWMDFFRYFLDLFRSVRDLFLFPVLYVISLFKTTVPEWMKTYVFLGVIFLLSYNRSYRKICGHPSESSLIRFIQSGFQGGTARQMLFWIFLWPIKIVGLLQHYTQKEKRELHHVQTRWGKDLLTSLILAFFLVFLNYILINVNG